MSKIKIIQIDIGEAPEGLYRQYLKKVPKYSRAMKFNFLQGEDIDALLEETYTIDRYPIQFFAYGDKRERYFIRDKDLAKFEELVSGYCKYAKKDLLVQLLDHVKSQPVMSKTAIKDVLYLLLEQLEQP